jgi:hypothetical protein
MRIFINILSLLMKKLKLLKVHYKRIILISIKKLKSIKNL